MAVIGTFIVVTFCFVFITGESLGAPHREDDIISILDKIQKLERRNDFLEKAVLELRKVNEDQQATIDRLSSRQKFTEMGFLKGDLQKRFVMRPSLPIAFSARLNPAELDHVNPGDVITFDDILTNYGAGLSANTSVFTAPMSGIYILACSLLDSFARKDGSGVMLHADIVKNGKQVLGRIFAHAEGSRYRDQGAQTVIAELQTGDTVWIRSWDSRDLVVGGELYSTFSGYLLWPLE